MSYRSLEDAVINGKNLVDPLKYVMQSGKPDELFSDQHGGFLGLLHYMVLSKSKEGVALLLDYGADPNLPDSEGSTPLQTAISFPDLEIIRLLVEGGADITVRDLKYGNTLLHDALIAGHEDTAQFLLDCGIDPDARNNLGIACRQLKSFAKLRQSMRGAKKGSLDYWLNSMGDNPGEKMMVHFLNMTAVLLESMVDQGKMSRAKARHLEQQIEKFNNIESWPEQLKSIKVTMMREIVKSLKTAFTEELSL